ncbi:GGDEF domain-containing protein [Actinocrispum wychmicini]|uniref:Diguanylate cyclase (GGDEF)-like protein n=1 Tax=Actinocrispum wychmicini TaxID=1213861 RepID=A0A4R2JF71_9PSEU|nr:GGDEF domain-containing protein [Actinocrispum wychmicini]TCO54909.1 diguanylate cyclase (GGDEF)-like protein [Actinocrispum wychmicini]
MSTEPNCASCGQPHGLWATDRLTLLLDRWGWDDRAAAVLRESKPTSLLVVDVDNFKRVNDRFGHVAGDEVLKGVAETLRRITRKSDLLGRYGGQGGDEFLVLLPETGIEDARVIAERIRAGIRDMAVTAPVPGGTTTVESVSVSIGVSVGDPDTDLESLVVDADAALRNAKRGGRDRVGTSKEHRRRAVPWRLAAVGACVAGAMIAVVTTDKPVPPRDSAADHPAAPPPFQLTVTVPATVTATPVRTPQAPKPHTKKTPAVREDTPTPSTTTRCVPCEMMTSAVNKMTPFLPH